MTETIYLLTIGSFLGVILLIFAMKYFSAAAQARARIAQEAGYRELADRNNAAQAEIAAAMRALQASTASIDARLATLEVILKQVE